MNSVRASAKAEIALEEHRRLVDAEKQRLRVKRPWWHGKFPIVISIKWRK